MLLATHLGRPDGKPDPRFVLHPVRVRVEHLLKRHIVTIANITANDIGQVLEQYPKQQLFLLQNLRFWKEEEENSLAFAKELASHAQLYVNDAFAVSHRAHASVSAITKVLPSVAGLLLEDELKNDNYGIYKLEYYPANMSNRKNAYLVGEAIDYVTQQTGRNKLNVISHSQGGLAVGGYIQNLSISPLGLPIKYYQNNIDKYIIIASPLYGSYFANLLDDVSPNNQLPPYCWSSIYSLANPPIATIRSAINLYGNSDATNDLRIGSDFIWELNNQFSKKDINFLIISGRKTLDDNLLTLIGSLFLGVDPRCLSNKDEINDLQTHPS